MELRERLAKLEHEQWQKWADRVIEIVEEGEESREEYQDRTYAL